MTLAQDMQIDHEYSPHLPFVYYIQGKMRSHCLADTHMAKKEKPKDQIITPNQEDNARNRLTTINTIELPQSLN